MTGFETNIRTLSAEEYVEILHETDYQLRVSDGTREGTWRFWEADGGIVYRRLSWTENKDANMALIRSVLENDEPVRQLVAVNKE